MLVRLRVCGGASLADSESKPLPWVVTIRQRQGNSEEITAAQRRRTYAAECRRGFGRCLNPPQREGQRSKELVGYRVAACRCRQQRGGVIRPNDQNLQGAAGRRLDVRQPAF